MDDWQVRQLGSGPPTDTCAGCGMQIWGGRFAVVRNGDKGFHSVDCMMRFFNNQQNEKLKAKK